MESAKVLIPLKYRGLIMSSVIGHQNQEHIAGEPASGQAKPIPPLNANHTTSQTAVKKSMLFNNMLESGNYREDKNLSAYDKALMKNLRKYNIKPSKGKFATSGGSFTATDGVGSPRARQKLVQLLYPKGLK